MNILFKNASIITHTEVLSKHSLLVQKGIITKIAKSIASNKNTRVFDLKGQYLAPGFIDLHVHGAWGFDTMDADKNSWNAISAYHATGGTTSFALTTMSCPNNLLLKILKLAKSKPELIGAELLGIHIEGPYLSKERPGVQSLKNIRKPKTSEWDKWIKEYKSVITQITLAPEIDGTIPLIHALKKARIIPSAGHTNATPHHMLEAFRAGLDNATHIFNCMSSVQKIGPFRSVGAVETVLVTPNIHAEVIADGFHVDPALIRLIYLAKGADLMTLVTDATAGAGLKSGKQFPVGPGELAQIYENCALTTDGRALAGSTIRMIDNIRTMVKLVKIPIHEAVRMATLNPAKRIRKEPCRGSLEKGKRADLVVFNKNFAVSQTWKGGKPIYLSSPKQLSSFPLNHHPL